MMYKTRMPVILAVTTLAAVVTCTPVTLELQESTSKEKDLFTALSKVAKAFASQNKKVFADQEPDTAFEMRVSGFSAIIKTADKQACDKATENAEQSRTDDSAPASDDSAPASDDSAPASDDSAPAPDDSIPAPDDSTPAPDDWTWASEDSTWEFENSTWEFENSTLALDGSTPASDDSTPTSDDSTPASEESTPASEYHRPSVIALADKPAQPWYERKGGNVYRFHKERADWWTAKATCEREGAYLAIINSEDEAQSLYDIFKEGGGLDFYSNYIWLGVSDTEEEGKFVTVRGDDLSNTGYEKWFVGQPDDYKVDDPNGEDCVTMRHDKTLNDVHCSAEISFMCERDEDAAFTMLVWENPFTPRI